MPMSQESQERLRWEITQRAKNLVALMEQPEEGCATWHDAVASNVQFLADWWAGKFANKEFP